MHSLFSVHVMILQALALAGAIFVGPVSGWIADYWGRKVSLMFSCVPYLFGYLLISYAHYSTTARVFKALLHTGRILSGVSMGWASTAVAVSFTT